MAKQEEIKAEIRRLKTKFNKLQRSKDYSHKGLTQVKTTADKIIKLRRQLKSNGGKK